MDLIGEAAVNACVKSAENTNLQAAQRWVGGLNRKRGTW